MIARRVILHGRVQGVGYRDWMVRAAREGGVSGWVRNRADGTVEALVAGDADAVAAVLRRCHSGPQGARVDRVTETPADPPAEPGFRRLPTA